MRLIGIPFQPTHLVEATQHWMCMASTTNKNNYKIHTETESIQQSLVLFIYLFIFHSFFSCVLINLFAIWENLSSFRFILVYINARVWAATSTTTIILTMMKKVRCFNSLYFCCVLFYEIVHRHYHVITYQMCDMWNSFVLCSALCNSNWERFSYRTV